MNFKEINPKELNENLIKLISDNWTLITTKQEDKVNMMTASWGGFGEMWGKEVSFCVIRPSRYTFKAMEQNDKYALCFFDENYKDVLTYCGKVSGYNEDKLLKTGLTVKEYDGFNYFEEARIVMFCEKLYSDILKKDSFKDKKFADKIYPDADIHSLYIGEIKHLFVK